MSMFIAAFGLGLGWLGAQRRAASGGGGSPPPSVALKADFSDANANEAWVFW